MHEKIFPTKNTFPFLLNAVTRKPLFNNLCLKNSPLFSLPLLHQALFIKPKYPCDYFIAPRVCSSQLLLTRALFPFLVLLHFLCLHFISLRSLRREKDSSVSFVLPNYAEYSRGYLILLKLMLNEEMSPRGFSVAHK